MKYKSLIFIIIGIIMFTMVVVYAEYEYASINVYYNNSNSTLNSTDVQNALEELDNKCEYKLSQVGVCPEGYNCTPTICKRATTLHTETCSHPSSTSYYCRGDGYASGATITYGQLGTSGSEPLVGDAFDCDVNGDGIYNSNTERFYYISRYYDTSIKDFDDEYYVLVYYSNVASGVASSENTVAWYSSSSSTSYGPTTAKTQLPSTSGTNAWRNDLLKTTLRNVLKFYTTSTETAKSNFSYEGKAARFLTYHEVISGCGSSSKNSGGLSYKCKFLMENTNYANPSCVVGGSWLETAYLSNASWLVYSLSRYIYYLDTTSLYGARPTIEIHKSLVSY